MLLIKLRISSVFGLGEQRLGSKTSSQSGPQTMPPIWRRLGPGQGRLMDGEILLDNQPSSTTETQSITPLPFLTDGHPTPAETRKGSRVSVKAFTAPTTVLLTTGNLSDCVECLPGVLIVLPTCCRYFWGMVVTVKDLALIFETFLRGEGVEKKRSK